MAWKLSTLIRYLNKQDDLELGQLHATWSGALNVYKINRCNTETAKKHLVLELRIHLDKRPIPMQYTTNAYKWA